MCLDVNIPFYVSIAYIILNCTKYVCTVEIQLFIWLCAHSFIHLFVRSFVPPSARSFVRPFIYSFAYYFLYVGLYPFIFFFIFFIIHVFICILIQFMCYWFSISNKQTAAPPWRNTYHQPPSSTTATKMIKMRSRFALFLTSL